MKKISLLFYGDTPTGNTGFSTVSKNILKRLQATGKYEISVLGINYFGEPHDLEYKIYPAVYNSQNDVYGRQKLLDLLRDKEKDFDVLFTLQDTFIMATIGEAIKKLKDGAIIEKEIIDKNTGEKEIKKVFQKGRGFKWVYYYPIDSRPEKSWIEDSVALADVAVPYTKYAKEESKKVFDRKYEIIYHGFDQETFHPMSEDAKENFRNKFFKDNNLKDSFLIVNVNRNQTRKGMLQTLLGFKEFNNIIPNSVLYTHCDLYDKAGHNLMKLANKIGLKENWLYPNPKHFEQQKLFSDDFINSIYNIADVNLSTTLGEGFGLCLAPETTICTTNGVKELKNITVNDSVYSDNGIFKSVIGIKKRKYTGKLYEILTWKGNKILASDNHPFYVNKRGYINAENLMKGDELVLPRLKEGNNNIFDIYKYIKQYLNLRQIKLLNVDNNYVNIQSNFKKEERRIKRHIDISNADVSRLLGLFVAEGCASIHGGQIMFSFHKKERDYIEFVKKTLKKYFCEDLVFKISDKPNSFSRTLKCSSSILAILFKKLFGENARDKNIDYSILNKINPLGFLQGLIEGDGYVSKHEVMVSTTSKKLCYSVRLLCSNLGIPCAIEQSRIEYKIRFSGKTRNILLKALNMGEVDINLKTAHEKCSVDDRYIVHPIKSIMTKDVVNYELIDIEIEDSKCFVAENCLVHNSMVESMAVKTINVFPDNTAIHEILKDKRGILVKSGNNPNNLISCGPVDNNQIRPVTDIHDLVGKLLWVYSHKDQVKEIEEVAYSWAQENLDWNKLTTAWDNLIIKTLKR